MKRREFITLFGSAAAWPLAARAQQPDKRIAVMIALPEGDPELKKWIAAFVQGLEKLGWAEGRNIYIDYRFAPAGARARVLARELLALQPDVVLAFSGPVTAAFQRATHTVPTVFIGIADAIAQRFVNSLARPDGNVTGLTMYEARVSGKYVSMLKEIEPHLTRATFLANPKMAPYYDFYLQGAEIAAPSLGVDVVFTPIENDASDIERVITAFARDVPKGGMVVVGDSTTHAHRDLIIALAARYRLPAVYWNTFFVTAGGLMSYGVDWPREFAQAALYVDRLLRGGKPADLPVQPPTKYETVINLKTAKALGIEVPPTMLARADEVIE